MPASARQSRRERKPARQFRRERKLIPASRPRQRWEVVQLPEYLIVAVVATAVAGFAKQLGDVVKRVRERRASQVPQAAGTTALSAQVGQESETVELRLMQKDGTYKVAAHGQVDNAMVRDIIQEIGDDA